MLQTDRYRTLVTGLWNAHWKVRVWLQIELLNLELWNKKLGRAAWKHSLNILGSGSDYCQRSMDNLINKWHQAESRNGHEVEAFISCLDYIQSTGLWHKGLTSSDLVECWIAWCIKHNLTYIEATQGRLIHAIHDMSTGQLTSGITHGQMAEPLTWGHRCRVWKSMLDVSLSAPPGKIGGAVGTGVTVHPRLAKAVQQQLGIGVRSCDVTQILPRTELCKSLNDIGRYLMAVQKVANDLRVLYTMKQITIEKMPVGSSAMPHKVNPYELERVVGLCKLAKSLITCVNETNADGWLERDLVHSSIERESLPAIYTYTDYVTNKLCGVLRRVKFPQKATIPPNSLSSLKMTDIMRDGLPRSKARCRAQRVTAREASKYAKRIKRTLYKEK